MANVSKPVHDPRVKDIACTEDMLIVRLRDGREIGTPLSWYPRLYAANEKQRAHWQPCHSGHGIAWPFIDEDLSVSGMLAGLAAPGGFTLD